MFFVYAMLYFLNDFADPAAHGRTGLIGDFQDALVAVLNLGKQVMQEAGQCCSLHDSTLVE